MTDWQPLSQSNARPKIYVELVGCRFSAVKFRPIPGQSESIARSCVFALHSPGCLLAVVFTSPFVVVRPAADPVDTDSTTGGGVSTSAIATIANKRPSLRTISKTALCFYGFRHSTKLLLRFRNNVDLRPILGDSADCVNV